MQKEERRKELEKKLKNLTTTHDNKSFIEHEVIKKREWSNLRKNDQ